MKVTGEGRMKQMITRCRKAPSVSNIGSQCDLSLKIPGKQVKEEKSAKQRVERLFTQETNPGRMESYCKSTTPSLRTKGGIVTVPHIPACLSKC